MLSEKLGRVEVGVEDTIVNGLLRMESVQRRKYTLSIDKVL